MKKYKVILMGVLALSTLSGCLKEYQELNTNPELLGETDPSFVFTGAPENFNNSSRNHLMAKYSGVMQMMQYLVNYQGAQEGVYVNPQSTNRPNPFTPYYSDYYAQIGLRLRYLREKVIPSNAEAERFQNLSAIAGILETYEAWLVFDVNGAAPYTEAFKVSEGIGKPRYDFYQEGLDGSPLYKEFDAKVKEYIGILQSNLPNQYDLGSSDFFYKGNVDNWIRFANTLRIKMAQRLELADATFYNDVLSEVLANPGGLISNNEQSCVYNHPNEYNNNTDDMHILTYQYAASRAFVNFMKEYDDPRLPLLVRRNGFGFGNNNEINDGITELLEQHYPDYQTRFPEFSERYFGMSSNPDSTSTLWSGTTYFTLPYTEGGVDKTLTVRHNSQIESRFYVKNGGKVGTQVTARDKEDATYDVSQNSISIFTPLITYSETCFMMAEIAFKSGSAKGGKDALTWYQEGIRASMQQYQTWAEKMAVPSAMNSNSDNYNPITSVKIDNYLSQTEFQTVSLEKIISQQWVNLFMRPEEAWATWKRTGLPAFKDQPIPEAGVAFLEAITTGGNSLVIPRRGALPVPNDANIDNFNSALERLTQDPNYGDMNNKTEGRIWWDRFLN